MRTITQVLEAKAIKFPGGGQSGMDTGGGDGDSGSGDGD